MFGARCALFAVAGAATTMLTAAPASAAPEDEFITLVGVVESTPDGVQTTGTYRCENGIGYLDVSAEMATSGSGTVRMASSPPGQTVQCTGQIETWNAVLQPASGEPVVAPYTEGTGTAQLNRKYWQLDSGKVALHTD